jgi:tRNA G10  N-methylase Trm11
LRVLDPLCGRGTTLNQALRDGCDAIGIDADRKDIEAYLSFLARYLETNRIKHRRDTARPAPDGRRTLRTTYTITPRGAGDPNQRPLTLDIINDDTRFIRDHIKGSSAHVVVADRPYGIQHGSRADARGESRNPAVLLSEALPVWRGVLRGGGAIALSYNTKVIGRDEVDAALAEADLVVVETLADGRFSHRVDQSIQRDISLATKPA